MLATSATGQEVNLAPGRVYENLQELSEWMDLSAEHLRDVSKRQTTQDDSNRLNCTASFLEDNAEWIRRKEVNR